MNRGWQTFVLDVLRALKRGVQSLLFTTWHLAGARVSRRSLVDKSSSGVVVSMASHGPRLPKVAACIQSIGRGALRPERLILTIDEKDVVPRSLQRMVDRGLEIRRGKRAHGPHNKYFAFVSSEPRFGGSLVTADDDILYPRRWLKALIEHSDSTTVAAFRGHTMMFRDGEIAPYNDWCEPDRAQNSPIFVTGVSGVAYPPEFVRQVAALGDAFVTVCPRQDDVWLNRLVLRGGFQVSLVDGKSVHFPFVLGTQQFGLVHENVGGGLNDESIAATYTATDVQSLLAMS